LWTLKFRDGQGYRPPSLTRIGRDRHPARKTNAGQRVETPGAPNAVAAGEAWPPQRGNVRGSVPVLGGPAHGLVIPNFRFVAEAYWFTQKP
jgi:hypothetical protein